MLPRHVDIGMAIRKIVFPVGGLGTRFAPITKAVPKEMLGILNKPLIHYAFEEAKSAGIDEFIFVTRRGKDSIEDYFDYMVAHAEYAGIKVGSVCYIRQNEPLGLGHAVLCAKNFVGDEPFAVISADDFIMSPVSCIGEMAKIYNGSNVIAVMNVAKSDVSKYGILDIKEEKENLIFAKNVEEKPSVDQAKSNCAIIGRYVLSPDIFEILSKLSPGTNNEIQLTDALQKMIPTHGLIGYKFSGHRFDCGSKEGMLDAILHVAARDIELKSTLDKFCGEYK